MLCLVAMGTIDVPAAAVCLGKDLPGDIGKGLNLTEVFAHAIGIALICLAFVVLDPRKRLLPRLFCLPILCGVGANLVKLVVTRHRPHSFTVESLPPALDTFGGFPGSLHDHALQSFPSGHTAAAVGFAIALSRLYPKASPLFISYALFAACQRVVVGAHFVSDTFAGSAVALLISAFFADRLFWDADWGTQR